jgi:hypothetical protein
MLPKAKLTKLKLVELAGVKEGAHDVQGTVLLKRKDERAQPVAVNKKSLLTSSVVGHAHLMCGVDDAMAGTTSSERLYVEGQTGDSYGTYHSHPWVKNADGSIVLGESMGHSHEALTDGATDVAKSGARNSTPGATTPTVKAHKEPTAMNPVVLTEGQFAHYQKLSGKDAETFLAKSHADREVDLQKAREADPVVHKTLDGTEIRKSAGELAVKFAKQADEQATRLAAQETEVAKAKAERETEVLKARAKEHIGHLAGTDEAKIDALRALETITDKARRDAAFEVLKSGDAFAKQAGVAKGVGGQGDPTPGDPEAEWNAEVKKFAEAKGIKDEYLAVEKFLGTKEGLVAKRKYDSSRAYGKSLPQA